MHLRGPEFLAFASVHLLALLSPGPDFAIVLKSSLTYTRKKALLVALGIAIGVVFHVSYSLIGLDFIQQRAHITILLRYIGSFYLIFIGVKSLCSRKDNKPVSGLEIVADDLSSIQALKLGFFTNILNIKAAFFTLSIFSVMLGPETSLVVKIFYGSFIIVTVFLWFALVALIFTADSLQKRFYGSKHWLERLCGMALISFGLRLMLS
jgi:threonine/homoserine/homoserine lactone efflux protein